MRSDKDQRPTFDQLLVSLDQLQQELVGQQDQAESPSTPTPSPGVTPTPAFSPFSLAP